MISNQKKTTWAADLSSLTKWTVTSFHLLLASSRHSVRACSLKKQGKGKKQQTFDSCNDAYCIAIVPGFWKANITTLWLPKCRNYSISAYACLHSVPQTLCLMSLMYYNYAFNVDQLSQNRKTSYHHYLQLFFTFSFYPLVFLVSLLVTNSCSFVVLFLNTYLAVNHLPSKELSFPLLLFPILLVRQLVTSCMFK